MSVVPFQYLLLGIGELLKKYDYATPEKLQTFISEDETFNIRPPLSECKMALFLMERVGFIKKINGEYRKNCE